MINFRLTSCEDSACSKYKYKDIVLLSSDPAMLFDLGETPARETGML